MATGWGAVGQGAWGAPTPGANPAYEAEAEPEPPRAPAASFGANAGAWGGASGSTYASPAQVQPELATTSQSQSQSQSHVPPAASFGANAYGQPAAGASSRSFANGAPAPVRGQQGPAPQLPGGAQACRGSYSHERHLVPARRLLLGPPCAPSQQNSEALRRKEAELAAKEKQLKELEAKLTEGGVIVKKKNWCAAATCLLHTFRQRGREDQVTLLACGSKHLHLRCLEGSVESRTAVG